MAGDEDPAAVSSSALGAALRLPLVSHQHLATAALSRANNFRSWRHPAAPERAGRAAKGRIWRIHQAIWQRPLLARSRRPLV